MKPKIPTQEQYIASRIADAKNRAIEYSKKRTETTMLPERFAYLTEDQIKDYKRYIDRTQKSLTKNENKKQSILNKYKGTVITWGKDTPENMSSNFNMKNKTILPSREMPSSDKIQIERLNNFIDSDKGTMKYYSDVVKSKGRYDMNCIATASCNYKDIGYLKGLKEPILSNASLRQNPSIYGFKEVKKPNVGDIITSQLHGVFYMGNDSVAYSPGDGRNIYKHGKYWMSNDNASIVKNYSFVGTPQDSLAWKKEYVDKYKNQIKK